MNLCHPVLSRIRQRPAEFLGRPSLIRLQAFLSGYAACIEDNRLERSTQDTTEFSQWLAGRLAMPRGLGYVEVLLARHQCDDAAAFQDFWRWLDEFHAHARIDDEQES